MRIIFEDTLFQASNEYNMLKIDLDARMRIRKQLTPCQLKSPVIGVLIPIIDTLSQNLGCFQSIFKLY